MRTRERLILKYLESFCRKAALAPSVTPTKPHALCVAAVRQDGMATIQKPCIPTERFGVAGFKKFFVPLGCDGSGPVSCRRGALPAAVDGFV